MTAPDQPVPNAIAQDSFVADVQAPATWLEEDGRTPDFIVGIGRGGLVPAAYPSHRTGIAMLPVDHSTRMPDFSDELPTRLATMRAAGRRRLFIDDIEDSDATPIHRRDTPPARGGDAADQRVALFIGNDRSPAAVDYRARTVDRATDRRWHVFPWEAVAPVAAPIEDARDVPGRLG